MRELACACVHFHAEFRLQIGAAREACGARIPQKPWSRPWGRGSTLYWLCRVVGLINPAGINIGSAVWFAAYEKLLRKQKLES